MARKYPLHLHIGALLAVLILLVSTTLGWVGYRSISRLILEDTERLFRQIPAEMEKAFSLRYRPVNAALAVLANSRITRTTSLQERLDYLSVLTEVIDLEPHVAGFQLGYPNGDYFIVRPMRNEQTRELFDAPGDAFYVVDHIAEEEGRNVQRRQFLGRDRQVISSIKLGDTPYDPRRRPWYVKAQEEQGVNHVTSPYRFFFLREYGVTLSRLAAGGSSVLAIDITLESLSETLAANRVSESAVGLLLSRDGDLMAETGLKLAMPEKGILNLQEIDNPLLSAFMDIGEVDGVVKFRHDGADWLGDRLKMHMVEGDPLRLFIAAPEAELFSSALEMRRNTVLLALVILLLAMPVAWLAARMLARPLRELSADAAAIANMDFSDGRSRPSPIREVDELMVSMETMKSTVGNFLSLINSLSGDPDIDHLLQTVTEETMSASGAGAAIAYLLDDEGKTLRPCASSAGSLGRLQPVSIDLTIPGQPLVEEFNRGEIGLLRANADDEQHVALAALCRLFDSKHLNLIMLPLRDRQGESQGLLLLVFREETGLSDERIGFSVALSGFAAVSMESGRLLQMQKRLLQSFIELMAGAIDAKSPYTGGHCQRVPELTQMLARAACEQSEGPFAGFSLDDDEWEALRIAAWLHDCGKVTTPEYVVDKSTKLETLYDRIHEVRMRFEVLKREAEIRFWEQLSAGGERAPLQRELDAELAALDDDFAFVAECNQGGEFMGDDAIQRLARIGQRMWRRTLDDRLGVSWEEDQRKQKEEPAGLPVDEPLLADRVSHIIERPASGDLAPDNPWGFKVDVPEHKYNRGELYNLSVRRGTLSDEERFTINGHMVQTIMMLEQLPFTGYLSEVPEIAGGHHEKMDGTGYPRRLGRDEMSVPARMMAIADIFEALTAADRPYKKAKTISESIAIMEKMVADQHIDAELFELFVSSGVHREYAEKFLDREQWG